MVDSGTAKIMITLLASLTITSILISFFVTSVLGYSVIPFGTVNLGLSSYSTTDNMVNSCNLSSYELTGSWSCNSNGLALVGVGSIKNLNVKIPDSGIYKNTYHYFPNGGKYSIIISETGYGGSFHVNVDSSGLHIPSSPCIGSYCIPDILDSAFYPISGASNQREVYLITEYDLSKNSLKINFNNNEFTIDTNKIPFTYSNDIKYYQGLSFTDGVLITSISNAYIPHSTETNPLVLIASFISNILALIVWNIDSTIFPWELNLALIKTQATGILICLIMILRG